MIAVRTRQLFGNPAAPAKSLAAGTSGGLSLAWTVLLLTVFVPLTTARYARR